jgi:endonuclease/exonuclease/phosphatase family metal-dependent hydrolase
VSTSPLSFFSWNLAMLERPAAAPLFWEVSNTEAVVREQVLQIEPDIVLFQELPGMVPFVETHSMIPANPKSHSGNLATLVHNQLATTELKIATVDGCAILTTFVELDLTIANVHLPAGKGAAPDRLMCLSKVIQASPTLPLVIVGDTNMRLDEADALLDFGFSGEKPPHPTWDSRRNNFRADAYEFSAYFTRWFASPGVAVSDVVVHRAPIKHDDKKFFVSDHYALGGQIVLS